MLLFDLRNEIRISNTIFNSTQIYEEKHKLDSSLISQKLLNIPSLSS